LAREGREQAHCVFALVGEVRARQRAIYKVLEPERATLSLTPTPGGWRLDEIVGPRNRPVSPATRQAVQRWLDSR
ncbi:MAG: hypothetical protein HY360_19240, partial [Verrucomicrobia bacterium]|nr:hypothetical protein [Verrucomicrobiota bacterium]